MARLEPNGIPINRSHPRQIRVLFAIRDITYKRLHKRSHLLPDNQYRPAERESLTHAGLLLVGAFFFGSCSRLAEAILLALSKLQQAASTTSDVVSLCC